MIEMLSPTPVFGSGTQDLLASAAGSDLGSTFARTALDGSLLLALPVAALAGIVAFLSPCVLPVVPGYLGYLTGMTGNDLAATGVGRTVRIGAGVGGSVLASPSARPAARSTAAPFPRSRVLLGSALFVLGFSIVFVVLGGFFGAIGYVLRAHLVLVTQLSGILVILLGLVFMGVVPWLGGERRIAFRPGAGLAGAPVLGIVFGLGWSPCMGPTLAAVSALSLEGGTPWRGALLAFVYSLGLGLPFLALAVLFRRAAGLVRVIARHRAILNLVGGAVLIGIGILLLTGLWTAWTGSLQARFADVFLVV